ncbi:MAG: glycosyltransferase 87 family protein [Chloroflexota bacterium]|nr:glycosyltransferase 87 family protein [Chloroflexota bacterium]
MVARLIRRLPRTLAMAILLGYLGYTLASWFVAWNPADGGAYYDAAVRLTHGGDLYPAINPEEHEVYRYAPWFAVAWIPITALPRDVALHAWSLAMLGCSVAAVWPLLQRPTWASVALAALAGQTLAETAMFGNAHPLVVALLVWTVGRRSFPIWVGIAASIKLVPLAFALVWAGRREWAKAVVAIATTALLFAPILSFDLSHYPTDPGTGLLSLYSVSPVLWAGVAVAALAATVWLAVQGSRYAWVAAALLMYLGPPRVVLSYLAFLVVAVELARRATPPKAAER